MAAVLKGNAPKIDAAQGQSAHQLVQAAIGQLEKIAAETQRVALQATTAVEEKDSNISEATKLLQEAAETGSLPSTGLWGQKFARDKNGGKSKVYRELKGFPAKAKFRADWANAEWTKANQSFAEESEEQCVDGSLGTYLCFKVIWDREGGDAEGYEANGGGGNTISFSLKPIFRIQNEQ